MMISGILAITGAIAASFSLISHPSLNVIMPPFDSPVT